jgi:hypothetical protein
MVDLNKLNLQLFAGEGAGGDGGGEGATGETAADAGQNMEARLLELGVPKDKIRKRAKAAPAPAAQPAQAQGETEAEGQAAAAATDGSTTEAPGKVSWDDFMSDPENNRRMQSIVQSRLKGAKAAEEAMTALTPALEVLARKYGVDIKDTAAIAEAVNRDAQYYEDKAIELGTSIDEAMKQDIADRDTARQQQQEADTLQQQKFQEHIGKLEQQAEAMKAVFPNFDLRAELNNPAFARMTSPNVGISVEDAYYAIHRREIQSASMQAAARKTAQKISNSIQAGMRRPEEAGASGQAPSVTTFDYRNASRDQREALKNRIRAAAARGEKLYPGQ